LIKAIQRKMQVKKMNSRMDESDKSELALNLWAYLDQGMGVVYALAGKVYALTGSEEEKLSLLQKLASTDHTSVTRQSVPKNFQMKIGDETLEGIVDAGTLKENMRQVFEELIRSIEAELPPIPNFETNEHTPQRIGQGYLSYLTFLLEDDSGKSTPITSREQSEQFALEQQKRELMRLFGLSEQDAEEMAQQMIRNDSRDLDDE
jgi:hypothetical protein